MPAAIRNWADLEQNYHDTILLGNGASIAVDGRFHYRSLLDRAVDENLLADDAQRLFDFFETEDFEFILRVVWHATNVNRSLQIPDEHTHAAYVRVRDCLIEAVRGVHPEYHEVRDHLPHIHRFLRDFRTVVSLNYDLIVYWATSYGLAIANRHSFKDCFVGGGLLHDNWEELRRPIRGDLRTTLVFYPHGSLILCRNRVEQEQKIHNLDNGLLGTILHRWESEEVVPLFVCEGTTRQKISSIQGSHYLSTVYREVLASRQDNLTIYGWGFGEQDLHLLKRFAAANLQRVAVSVYRGDQAYCRRAEEILRQELGQNIRVEFFDSESAGCWRYPAQE